MTTFDTLRRVLWLSNDPRVPSGYGTQTRLFGPRVAKILNPAAPTEALAFCSYFGVEGHRDTWQGYTIYPKYATNYGQDIVGGHATHFRADLILSLMDIWVCEPERYGGIPFAAWCPLDHEGIPPRVMKRLRQCAFPIVYSTFAQRLCEAADIPCAYVPHGVETARYRPISRARAREALNLPQDAFVVGLVAANVGNPSRKAFPQQLAAFAAFRERHPDAILYAHTTLGMDGAFNGINLPRLCESLGLTWDATGTRTDVAVRFSNPYGMAAGFSDDHMVTTYNALDVLLEVTRGEGFGLPLLEAQACGVPVITGAWTACEELCFTGWTIPREFAVREWTGLEEWQYLPIPGAILGALEAAYQAGDLTMRGRRARKRALAYDAEKVARDYWRPVLREIDRRLAERRRTDGLLSGQFALAAGGDA